MKPFTKSLAGIAVAAGVVAAGVALAAQDPHAGHGAHGGQETSQAASSRSVTTSVVLGKQKAAIRIEDAREHFNKLHAQHMNHPGIPTHRLVMTYAKGTVPDSAEVTLILPSRKKQATSLWKEGQALHGQLELREKGTYRVTVTVPQKSGKVSASFTLTP